MKHFIVIDMQNDFVTGSLANKNAEATIPFIKEKLTEAKKNGDTIIFTKDTHHKNYLETLEGKHLPVEHCIEGTKGHDIIPEFKEFEDEAVIIYKDTFGYTAWDEFIKPDDEVTICGTVSSICVAANVSAIKSIGEVEVTVLKDGCSDLDDEGQKAALKVMASQHAIIA